MPSLGMGRIFTIGSTAAMAWELPHEPMVFLDKKHKKTSNPIEHKQPEIVDSLPMYYENGPTHDYEASPDILNDYSHAYDRQYNRYQSYNTRNADSKYYNFNGYDRNSISYASRVPQHDLSFGHYVEPEHRYVYIRTRRDLYGKLQKLLNALGRDGRACILKIICEVSQVAKRKGTFMEEIVKAIFRIKTHEQMVKEDEYDHAFNKNHNCTERYETCSETFFGRYL